MLMLNSKAPEDLSVFSQSKQLSALPEWKGIFFKLYATQNPYEISFQCRTNEKSIKIY